MRQLSTDLKKSTLFRTQSGIPDGFYSWKPVSGVLAWFETNRWTHVATLTSVQPEDSPADELFFKLG